MSRSAPAFFKVTGGEMNNRWKILFAPALMLISSTTVWTQSQLLTNPAQLAQFPSVERIRTATKGTDDVDSHARFIAALYRINDMMIRDLLTAPNGGMYTLPPAAAPVQEQYRRALSRYSIDEVPPAGRDPRFRPLETKYESDPAFFDDLLVQLFSSKFRADYYAWVRKPVPQLAAAASAKGPSPDPSIAKAKAAKMDTTVFGLELGQPLSLPTCTGVLKGTNNPTCVYDSGAGTGLAILDYLTSMIPSDQAQKADPNVMQIQLDDDHCPAWLWVGCQAEVLLHDGVLVAVAVSTNGRKVENLVNAELRAKYGPPTIIQSGTITPDIGNAFEVKEPVWTGKGIRVEYQIVLHNDQIGVDTRSGWVRVITETAYERMKQPAKRKM